MHSSKASPIERVPTPVAIQGSAAQRRAFMVVLSIEVWERFGFYGMAALMVLFMVQGLGYSDHHANLSWGALSSLVFAVPALGGWVGDRWLGARRAMLAGTVVLACGYALLAASGTVAATLYPALALVAIGVGLFKPNGANLVRRIYEGQPARIDSAFTVYYMGVNIGSTVAMLATPWVSKVWGWGAAFAVSGVGLLLGLLNYALMRRALEPIARGADATPLSLRRLLVPALLLLATAMLALLALRHVELAAACVVLVGFAVLVAFAVLMRRGDAQERTGLATSGLLFLQVSLFFVFYQQMSTSLTLFALRNVDPRLHLPGLPALELLPAQFQALNPIWIMLLSPLLAWLYEVLARGRGDLPIGLKFALGFAAVAGGFGVFAASGLAGGDGRVPAGFMVGGYGLISLGELLLSGLGLAVVARYVPARFSGFMMGAYFAVTGIAMYVGGYVANLAQPPGHLVATPQESLRAYTTLFGRLSLLSLFAALVSLALLPWLRRFAPRTAR